MRLRPTPTMIRAAMALLLLLLLLTAALSSSPPGITGDHVTGDHVTNLNHRPIIGILAQENLQEDRSPQGTSYIAASYVKYLESAGARVVPIRINRPEEEYVKLFASINGLLLPGGDVDIETSQCTQAAKTFYKLAVQANEAGDYFPVWGTCQGFQQLSVLTAKRNLLTRTDTEAVALPLTLSSDVQRSRLFRHFPKNLLHSLTHENVTANFHQWSLTVQDFNNNPLLKRFYKILSTNTDGKVQFISTMEGNQYPFYGVQWHPEKGPFEWIDKPGIVHSAAAVQISFHMASFFVSEARKNQHKFSSEQEEETALIYNHIPHYKKNFYFVQNYYFD
ncbi:unnamed protein product [Knipowitschia caucasica]|uniref:folate gamma-glutamyl hydrolase n=1 Tax=Knipowitschia caucasica TaxID=637954 RepID=A0AAV2M4I4_KNICA